MAQSTNDLYLDISSANGFLWFTKKHQNLVDQDECIGDRFVVHGVLQIFPQRVGSALGRG